MIRHAFLIIMELCQLCLLLVGPGILVVLGGASLLGKRGRGVEKYKIQEVN